MKGTGRNSTRYVILAIFMLVLLTFPFFGGLFDVRLMTLFFMWAIVAMCWNLLIGYAGIFAAGNLVFFAVGGYTSAWIAKYWGVSPFIGILTGGCIAILPALVIGVPTLRLTGIYVALFTFASEELMRNVVVLPELTPWTGGPMGLQAVPSFSIGALPFVSLHYYIGFVIFLITSLTLFKLINSKIGLAVISIRESETYSASLGVNIYKHKLLVFIVSAFFTGVAGSFYAHFNGAITDTSLEFVLLVSIIFMVLVGGQGTFLGPILGAFILTFVTEYLRSFLTGYLGQARYIVTGLMIPLILIFWPSGIVKIVDFILKLVSRTKEEQV